MCLSLGSTARTDDLSNHPAGCRCPKHERLVELEGLIEKSVDSFLIASRNGQEAEALRIFREQTRWEKEKNQLLSRG